MLTLRQIEVARAVMVTGTIAGAARFLNVSAPGISRLMKHTEASLGIRLFDRRSGRLVPSDQARSIFEQIDVVFEKVEDLRYLVGRIQCGVGQELMIGSVPSISHVMVPRAIEVIRKLYPKLVIDISIVKIEDAVDYLLLGKGEVVALSSRLENPALAFEPLAVGRLFCIVPHDHALTRCASVSAAEIARHPLIGVDRNDPHGRILTDIFHERGISYEIAIRARFGSTVCTLVRAGLGIAVIDQFTIADEAIRGIHVLPIDEDPRFETWVATKAGKPISAFAARFIRSLRAEMFRATQPDKASTYRASMRKPVT